MRAVRTRNTEPEQVTHELLRLLGYSFRTHASELPGTPDIVFDKGRKAIFVHGCFWHGHDCGRGVAPKTNSDFWTQKIAGNRVRDAKQIEALRAAGWQVETIWQCETKRREIEYLSFRLIHFLEG